MFPFMFPMPMPMPAAQPRRRRSYSRSYGYGGPQVVVVPAATARKKASPKKRSGGYRSPGGKSYATVRVYKMKGSNEPQIRVKTPDGWEKVGGGEEAIKAIARAQRSWRKRRRW